MKCKHLFEDTDSFTNRRIRNKALQLSRHSAFNKSDHEDIEQELALEIHKKYPSHDPGRGTEEVFVACVIKSKALSLLRSRLAKKRDFRCNGKSLNETVPGKDSCELSQTLASDILKRHKGYFSRSTEELTRLRFDVSEVIKQLPDDLRHLASLLQEMPKNAASKELGKSPRQVTNDVSRLRELFERAELRDYL
jgi:DNA-directed RNA polymerase specialized sigma24 family protein